MTTTTHRANSTRPAADASSFHLTGEHRPWCSDHASDIVDGTDFGWCRSAEERLGNVVLQLTESGEDERPAVRLMQVVIERGRECHAEGIELAPDVARKLGHALIGLADEITPVTEESLHALEVMYESAGWPTMFSRDRVTTQAEAGAAAQLLGVLAGKLRRAGSEARA